VVPWRWVAALASDGLHLRRGQSSSEVRLAWIEHEAAQPRFGSGLTFYAGPQLKFWGVRPAYGRSLAARVYVRQPQERSVRRSREHYVLDDRFFADLGGTRLLAYLCEFVASTPAARPGLDDPTRTTALLMRLATDHLHDGAWPQSGPWWSGRRYDLFLAVSRVLDKRVHTVAGRRIDSEPSIDIDAAVQDATDLLLRVPHLDRRGLDPNRVRAEIERQLLRAKMWPFGVLLAAPSEVGK